MVKSMKVIIMLFLFALLMLFVDGCGLNKSSEDKLNIVSTTTMLSDLISTLGGEKVKVKSLMGAGVDPHLYKASAGDVSLMQNADIIVYNGLHLEGKMSDAFESLEKNKKDIIRVSDYIEVDKLIKEADEIYDPHIWFSVDLWMDVARGITNRLSNIDSDNKEYYESNLKYYLLELEDLNDYIKSRIEEVEEDKRVLVTAHDAFSYFGKYYGFEVKGLQGISTDSEAGTSDISKLANFIVARKIKSIFVESSVPPKTIEALKYATRAKGFEVNIGGELYSDSLGDKKSNTETYIKTFKFNVDTIVNSLK